MSASYGIGNLAAGLGALSTQLGKIGFGEGANLSALGQLTGKAAEPTGDLLKSLAGTSGGLIATGVKALGSVITGIGKTATATPAEVTSFAKQAAQQSRAFFEYPEVFRITLMPDGQTDNPHIFQIAECVLEDFKVDYDPQGGARYVRGENNVPAPASVKISMTFKETSLVTKENIKARVFSQRDLVGRFGARATGVETGSGL